MWSILARDSKHLTSATTEKQRKPKTKKQRNNKYLIIIIITDYKNPMIQFIWSSFSQILAKISCHCEQISSGRRRWGVGFS
jgi:hypothetical protein